MKHGEIMPSKLEIKKALKKVKEADEEVIDSLEGIHSKIARKIRGNPKEVPEK